MATNNKPRNVPDPSMFAHLQWKPGMSVIKRGLLDPRVPSDFGLEQVLVFAQGPQISVRDNDGQVIPFATRSARVCALCSHQGRLYDAGEYKTLNDTISGAEVSEIREAIELVGIALRSHEGKLYGACESLFDVLTRERLPIQPTTYFTDLCSHNGTLYGTDSESRDNQSGHIFKLPSMEKIQVQRKPDRLWSHNDKLFGSMNFEIFEVVPYKSITTRPEVVTAMCTLNGILVDSMMNGQLTETFSGRTLYEGLPINAMCAHPRKYFVEAGVLK